jgi:hypothetical protein
MKIGVRGTMKVIRTFLYRHRGGILEKDEKSNKLTNELCKDKKLKRSYINNELNIIFEPTILSYIDSRRILADRCTEID